MPYRKKPKPRPEPESPYRKGMRPTAQALRHEAIIISDALKSHREVEQLLLRKIDIERVRLENTRFEKTSIAEKKRIIDAIKLLQNKLEHERSFIPKRQNDLIRAFNELNKERIAHGEKPILTKEGIAELLRNRPD